MRFFYLTTLFVGLGFGLYLPQAAAQLCNGTLGDPVVAIDFGSGAAPGIGSPLPNGTTTYTFAQGYPPDGSYTVSTNTGFGNDWHQGPDHTPNDQNGYTLVFNASYASGEFYRRTVTGLCPGTTYEFAAWMLTLNSVPNAPCGPGVILPNVTFQVRDLNNNVLGSVNTGNIPGGASPNWQQFGILFNTGNGNGSVQIVMINNAPGGCGNDLAIDDITFRPCGDNATLSVLGGGVVCEGSPLTLVANLSGNIYPNPFLLYQQSVNGGPWTDIAVTSSLTYTINAAVAGTSYRFWLAGLAANLQNSNCRVLSNVITPQVAPGIVFSITPDNSVCSQPNGSASVQINNPSGTYTYQWSNGATGAVANNLLPGTYSVTITSQAGCVANRSVVIGNSTSLSISETHQGAHCNVPDGSINLNASSTSPPISFLWSNGSTTEDLNNIFSGDYSVTVSDGAGCTEVVNIFVEEIFPFTISLNAVNISCFGNDDGSLTATITGLPSTHTYLWNTGATTANMVGLSSGSYTVTVTDANGCSTSESVDVVEPNLLTVDALSTNLSCLGNYVAYPEAAGGTLPYSYSWDTGESTDTISILQSGTYALTLTDVNGCTAIDAVTVSIEVAQVLFHVTDNVCFAGMEGVVTVDSVTVAIAPYEYSSDGLNFQSSPVLTGLPTGLNTFYVRDVNGCVLEEQATIASLFGPFEVETSPDAQLLMGETYPLYTVSNSSDELLYVWSPTENLTCSDCPNPTALAVNSTIYAVTATDENGCTATDAVAIWVEKERNVFAPNAFTPDANGLNDLFSIFGGLGVVEISSLSVFDRWGNLLYHGEGLEPKGAANAWDGTFNDKPLDAGVYVYLATVLYLDGLEQQLSGELHLIR